MSNKTLSVISGIERSSDDIYLEKIVTFARSLGYEAAIQSGSCKVVVGSAHLDSLMGFDLELNALFWEVSYILRSNFPKSLHILDVLLQGDLQTFSAIIRVKN